MRIAFDGTTLQERRTGVSVYTEALLRHLAPLAEGDEIVVFSNGPVRTAAPLPASVRVLNGRSLPIRLVWIQGLAPFAIRSASPDVVHFTTAIAPISGGRVPTVLTVHDMSMTLHPQMHGPARRFVARPIAEHAIARATAILTPSEHTRRDVLETCHVPADRVHVLPLAAASEFTPMTSTRRLDGLRAAYGLAERFLLHVGTIEPRKNLERLLEAFARVRKGVAADRQLVMAGAPGRRSGDVVRRIHALGLGDAVRLTGYVPFDDLPALFNAAEVVVFPSLYEGFGLPVVEAMACGRPIVASSTSAVGELVGDAAERIDPGSADSIAAGLRRVLEDPDWRCELGARALARARGHSWTATARRTFAIYRQVAGR
jgi:glycosyltransferase involved in cell wall biosynthesis